MKPRDAIVPRASLILIGVVVVACAALYLAGGTAIALVLTDILIMSLFASSLNLLMSYGGMVSFGHAAYFGIGAYGFTLPIAKFGMAAWLGLFTGPLVAVLAALVFGAL